MVLGLSLLACGKPSDVAVVEGRLLGADGKPPALAHVHLVELGGDFRESVKSVKVGGDGAFSLSVPRDRYYELALTAVNHRAARVPLAVDLKRGVKGLEVTLAANQCSDSLTEVGIFGDWNDFDPGAADPMTRLPGGTFAFERKVEADTLAYQLTGVTVDGRGVNGTDADRYHYDGGGDYISVVAAHGDTARVTFDPKRLVIPGSQDLPKVEAARKNAPIEQMFAINRRFEQEIEAATALMMKYWEEHGSIGGFTYDALTLRQYLMEQIGGRVDLDARKYAAVKLADLLGRDVSLSQDELAAIGKVLTPSDRVWADSPSSVAEFFRRTEGPERMAELFEGGLGRIADRRVKAVMLLEVGLRARDMGDTAKQRTVFDDLCGNYADASLPEMVQYRMASELNPGLRINKGKPLPHFELALLDGSGKVSKQTLQGKYCLIDLWATWCGPCVGEMANLHKAYERFKGPGFEILSISFDRRPEDVAQFRAGDWPMPWLNAYSEGMFQSEAATVFEVAGIPKPILVDPQGMIVECGMGLRGDNLTTVLARYLGE
ncbi:MAG: thioredoxin-like domain-containing protein [bacterium]